MEMGVFNQISFLQIEIFILIVEMHSFTEAAKKLHLTQTAVSKSMLRLAAKLNCRLFIGNTRNWELTPEGKRLYHNWKEHYTSMKDCYEKIVLETQSISSLKVGIIPFVNMGEIYRKAVDDIHQLFPAVNISPGVEQAQDILDCLRSHKYDCILVPSYMRPFFETEKRFQSTMIARSSLFVLVPAEDSLSKKDYIDLDDMREHIDKFLITPDGFSYLNQIVEEKKLPHIPPTSKCESPEAFRMNYYKNLQHMIIVDSYTDTSAFSNAVAIELKFPQEEERNSIGMMGVWRKDNESPVLKCFVSGLKKYGLCS